MTSLIDVIFLLLLFFMLTSTFSKFAEIDLSAAGAGTSNASNQPPLFLRLGPEHLTINGTSATLTTLTTSLLSQASDDTILLVSIEQDVTAQRLTDLLVALRALPHLRVTVLGA